MRLGDKDRTILAYAEMQGSATVAELGAQTGFREHTVRYFLTRCKESGLIRRRCYVNLHKLGYQYYVLYFSLSAAGLERETEIVRALGELDRVTWIAKIGGDYQYAMTFCARSIYEASDYLDQFAAPFGRIFYERGFSTRLSFTFFGNKFLAPDRRADRSFTIRPSDTVVSIDECDHAVLSALVEDGEASFRKIARTLKLPVSTLELRRKKLEDSGVLAGYYYFLRPTALSTQAFVVLIGIRAISNPLREEFAEFCRRQPNITTFINTIGQWDFELAVALENAGNMHSLTSEMQKFFGAGLQYIKVMPLYSFVKATSYPFRQLNPAA